jgi:ribosomal protein S18 acetylase RimI-like enzyme
VSVEVRRARDDELEAAGDAVAEAYRGNPGMDEDGDYLEYVRDARGRAADSEVLVAVDTGGVVLGSVSYVAGAESPMADLAHEGEAEFRMLGVLPAERGSGVGTELVEACVARARADRRSALVLSTPPDWTTGQRLYEALGFRRAPDRDFDPVPGFRLWAYVIDL